MNLLANVPGFVGAQPYRMAAADYIRAILTDSLGSAHVELVEGELIEMAPSGLEHGRQNANLTFDLSVLYRPLGRLLCIDAIVQLSETTVRAPDITVIDTEPKDRNHLLPADILLAVEISQSTLTEDIGRKRVDYASAGIRHYWVVDVEGRRVHTYADPQGADYAAIRVYAFGDSIDVPGAEGTITIT